MGRRSIFILPMRALDESTGLSMAEQEDNSDVQAGREISNERRIQSFSLAICELSVTKGVIEWDVQSVQRYCDTLGP